MTLRSCSDAFTCRSTRTPDPADAVVQLLSLAVYALDDGDVAQTRTHLTAALTAARRGLAAGTGSSDHLPAPTAPARPRPTVFPVPTTAVSVLIADDTADIRDVLRRMLSRYADIRVVGEAADGREAVELAVALRPDFVVLDYSMPRMDGLAALAELRARVPDTCVVMLSGHGADLLGARALAAGAVAFIEKGGSLLKLVDVLREQAQARVA